MKKLFIFFTFVLGVFVATSCEKNEAPTDDRPIDENITISATIKNSGTRTTLGEESGGRYPVLWCKGDRIAVINGDNIFEFTLQGEGGTAMGTFKCTSGNLTDFDATKAVKAFYPYENISFSNGEIAYTVPAEQNFAQRSFGSGAVPMAAYSDGAESMSELSLVFENLFGVLKLQLKGPDTESVESIEIISENILNGVASVAIDDAVAMSLTGESDTNRRITLDCGDEGVVLSESENTEFLIALPAGVQKLEVLIHTTKASYYKAIPSTSGNQITVGNILFMPVLNTLDLLPAYIENGVYRGDGVKLPKDSNGGTLIWAPVNCGYDETHPYGLLYQWGRKYGQGSNSEEPQITYQKGQTSTEYANSEANKNLFYYNSTNWNSSTRTNNLWSTPRTDYDPCPKGWRVPTSTEMVTMSYETSSYHIVEATEENGAEGIYFYGKTNDMSGNRIFLPAAGYRGTSTRSLYSRGENGYYWTSSKPTSGSNQNVYACYWSYSPSSSPTQSGYFIFYSSSGMGRANGMSVRCVKE